MAGTRVLITNDDGVDSPGIHALARHVEQAGYEVLVVAPDHDASGTGAALGRISPDHPIALTETSIDGLAARVYAIGGPPALCVMAGNLEAFAPRPDIVISGINAGLNTGRAALHSGTIGAALAAQNFGLRALSVSLASSETWHWDTAAELAVEVLPAVVDGPDRGLLNLNVPGVPREEVRGILWTGFATFNSVRGVISKIENGKLHFGFEETGHQPEGDTDLAAVRKGYAAVTSIQGTVEVWGPVGAPGEPFERGHRVHAATAGHELRPARSYLIPG